MPRTTATAPWTTDQSPPPSTRQHMSRRFCAAFRCSEYFSSSYTCSAAKSTAFLMPTRDNMSPHAATCFYVHSRGSGGGVFLSLITVILVSASSSHPNCKFRPVVGPRRSIVPHKASQTGWSIEHQFSSVRPLDIIVVTKTKSTSAVKTFFHLDSRFHRLQGLHTTSCAPGHGTSSAKAEARFNSGGVLFSLVQ
jgi:hypothetical protein